MALQRSKMGDAVRFQDRLTASIIIIIIIRRNRICARKPNLENTRNRYGLRTFNPFPRVLGQPYDIENYVGGFDSCCCMLAIVSIRSLLEQDSLMCSTTRRRERDESATERLQRKSAWRFYLKATEHTVETELSDYPARC